MNDSSKQLITPNNIQVNQNSDQLIIIRKWLNQSTLIFTAFTVFWNGFIFLMIWGIESSSASITNDLLPLAVFSLFLVIGIYMIYVMLAKWLNRTSILANNEEIIIRHQPLPWLTQKQLRVTKLKRLYSKEVDGMQVPGQYISYEIYAKTNTGADKKLVVVSSGEEAWFIERKLEDYYNIQDEPQQGEINAPVVIPEAKLNIPNPPNNIQVDQTEYDITIIKKWLVDSTTRFLTLFSIAWISFPLIFLILIILKPSETLQSWLLPLSPFIVVAIFLSYFTIATWLNRTYIFANDQTITVHYKPIPCFWLRNQQLRVANVKRLYSKKVYPILREKGKPINFNYEIHANTHAGGDKKLLVVSTPEEALFIERTLEDYYSIQDQPQQGEIGSDK